MNLQDNQLDGIAESHVQEGANGVTKLAGDGLGGVAEQAGEWNDGDGIHCEDDARAHAEGFGDDADGDEDEEHVDPAVEQDHLTREVEAGKDARFLLLFGSFVLLQSTLVVYDSPLPRSFRRYSNILEVAGTCFVIDVVRVCEGEVIARRGAGDVRGDAVGDAITAIGSGSRRVERVVALGSGKRRLARQVY